MTRVIEHVWIEMRDGVRLSARLWLPDDAEQVPVPAILEYIPYRKRDGTRGRDEPIHGYFAEHGYAALRVDMRGAGDSEGLLWDEYLAQEQQDAIDVIAWAAAQPWCSGKVGMFGKSWGGFNGLQVAAHRPPALKAVVSCYTTDNRYRDDIHYMGGLLLNDNLWWGNIMITDQCRPPDPEVVGENWRNMWQERLDNLPCWPANWMEHPTYDDYWRHGSVGEDWSAIECPVLVVGGWEDSYTNPVPRLLENLNVPCRAILGPWGHIYPQDGVPGPAIGFLQECVRWWDHWLKDIDRGVMDDPKMRAYLCDSYPAEGSRNFTPGRWVGERQWPSSNINQVTYNLNNDFSLSDKVSVVQSLTISSPLSHGKAGGEWMATGCAGEHPADQRIDDGGSLNFDTATLEQDFDVLGAPVLKLTFSVDQEIAQISIRLSDVRPDGQITRVSYQVFNLNHINGHDKPSRLIPGQIYHIDIPLNTIGYHLGIGHRVRVSIGTCYWPLVWPSPRRTSLSVYSGETQLELPVRASYEDEPVVSFPESVHGKDAPITQLSEGILHRYSQQDYVSGLNHYVTEGIGGLFGEGVQRFDEIGTVLDSSLKRHLTIHDDDPLSACCEITQHYRMGREGWMFDIDTVTILKSDLDQFILTARVEVKENGQSAFVREWNRTFPRLFL